LATGTAIRGDVAMTGEITLRGRVLPVGGVREKALAALRNGVTTMILPKTNMKDTLDIPRQLKRKMTFIPVEQMSEVLDAVFVQESTSRSETPPTRIAKPISSQPVASRMSRKER